MGQGGLPVQRALPEGQDPGKSPAQRGPGLPGQDLDQRNSSGSARSLPRQVAAKDQEVLTCQPGIDEKPDTGMTRLMQGGTPLWRKGPRIIATESTRTGQGGLPVQRALPEGQDPEKSPAR